VTHLCICIHDSRRSNRGTMRVWVYSWTSGHKRWNPFVPDRGRASAKPERRRSTGWSSMRFDQSVAVEPARAQVESKLFVQGLLDGEHFFFEAKPNGALFQRVRSSQGWYRSGKSWRVLRGQVHRHSQAISEAEGT
jgi:hypothetical protein